MIVPIKIKPTMNVNKLIDGMGDELNAILRQYADRNIELVTITEGRPIVAIFQYDA